MKPPRQGLRGASAFDIPPGLSSEFSESSAVQKKRFSEISLSDQEWNTRRSSTAFVESTFRDSGGAKDDMAMPLLTKPGMSSRTTTTASRSSKHKRPTKRKIKGGKAGDDTQMNYMYGQLSNSRNSTKSNSQETESEATNSLHLTKSLSGKKVSLRMMQGKLVREGSVDDFKVDYNNLQLKAKTRPRAAISHARGDSSSSLEHELDQLRNVRKKGNFLSKSLVGKLNDSVIEIHQKHKILGHRQSNMSNTVSTTSSGQPSSNVMSVSGGDIQHKTAGSRNPMQRSLSVGSDGGGGDDGLVRFKAAIRMAASDQGNIRFRTLDRSDQERERHRYNQQISRGKNEKRVAKKEHTRRREGEPHDEHSRHRHQRASATSGSQERRTHHRRRSQSKSRHQQRSISPIVKGKSDGTTMVDKETSKTHRRGKVERRHSDIGASSSHAIRKRTKRRPSSSSPISRERKPSSRTNNLEHKIQRHDPTSSLPVKVERERDGVCRSGGTTSKHRRTSHSPRCREQYQKPHSEKKSDKEAPVSSSKRPERQMQCRKSKVDNHSGSRGRLTAAHQGKTKSTRKGRCHGTKSHSPRRHRSDELISLKRASMKDVLSGNDVSKQKYSTKRGQQRSQSPKERHDALLKRQSTDEHVKASKFKTSLQEMETKQKLASNSLPQQHSKLGGNRNLSLDKLERKSRSSFVSPVSDPFLSEDRTLRRDCMAFLDDNLIDGDGEKGIKTARQKRLVDSIKHSLRRSNSESSIFLELGKFYEFPSRLEASHTDSTGRDSIGSNTTIDLNVMDPTSLTPKQVNRLFAKAKK